MTRNEINQLIIEASDKIYNTDESSISLTASALMAEILTGIEQVLTEVLYQMQINRGNEYGDE